MEISPELALKAYAAGIFPMADTQDAQEVFWVDPKRRGIIPLDRFHISRRLKRTVKQHIFTVTINRAFEEVIAGCAEMRDERQETWINSSIRNLFLNLHRSGFAHSVECWRGDFLAGGLYGLSLGSAFFGESMFSRATDASKVALVHLVARLNAGGYTLLDTQFVTEHLRHFGACEISRGSYRRLLAEAISQTGDFYSLDLDGTGADGRTTGAAADLAQPVSQTS